MSKNKLETDIFSLLFNYAMPMFSTRYDNIAYRSECFIRPKIEGNEAIYKIPVPGASQDHIRVWVENSNLNIKIETFDENKNEYDQFIAKNSYSWTLPTNFDENKIKAHLKNGVLKISVPLKSSTDDCVKNIKVEVD